MWFRTVEQSDDEGRRAAAFEVLDEHGFDVTRYKCERVSTGALEQIAAILTVDVGRTQQPSKENHD
jgi:protein-tyrosine-phosphatase